jgi:two-component system sensor histidine kinase QseC
VREAAALMLPLAEERGRPLEADIPQSVTLGAARADDLRDMVRNLIENALIHGAGKVSVGLMRGERGAIRLTVSDEGAPPADGDALFEEFRKGDGGSIGAGLGLAIVQQVAAAHGGAARFLGGTTTTTIEVVLPAR